MKQTLLLFVFFTKIIRTEMSFRFRNIYIYIYIYIYICWDQMAIWTQVILQFFNVFFPQNLCKRLEPKCHFGPKKKRFEMTFRFLWFLYKKKIIMLVS